MPRTFVFLLGLVATACGGNFSNEDLEYLSALPTSETLKAHPPAAVESQTNPDLRRALEVGEPSKLFRDSRDAAGTFNQAVDNLLSFLELFRALPPSERADNERIWGPYPDDERPGLELRFVMTREDEKTFTYHLDYRPRRSTSEGDWWSLLTGDFLASGGIRKGEGHLHLNLAGARSRGMRNLLALDALHVSYQTQALPTRVQLIFEHVAGDESRSTTSTSRALPEGYGEIEFFLEGNQVIPGGLLENLRILSQWTPNSGGRGSLVIEGGDAPGERQDECWDAHEIVRYLTRSWSGLQQGSLSACPDLSPLSP